MATQANFQQDAHTLRLSLEKQIRDFQRKYPAQRVKSVTIDNNGAEPVVDLNIRPAEMQVYQSKAGVTVPLASRGRPPAPAAPATDEGK